MTQIRSKIVEAMARKLAALMIRDGQRFNTTEYAEAALDIALKAAAEIARHACLVPPDGGAPTAMESEMCDRAAAAILALTSEGTKP